MSSSKRGAFSAVIFDLDGTLLNTLEDLADSVNFALGQFGFPPRTYGEVRDFVGNGVSNLVRRSLPGGQKTPEFEDVLALFRRHYSENCRSKTRPYGGILELLRALSGAGIKMAVVSNKYDAAVKELVRLYFGDLIPVAIGESEKARRKPAPDTVLSALAQLGAAAEGAVYVGDSEVDLQTAKNAGLPCITVTWGFRDKASLAAAGAETMVDSVTELLRALI